ncbi:MAG: hypothetical protein SGARI_005221, partial [Bacillariaceae sp.]
MLAISTILCLLVCAAVPTSNALNPISAFRREKPPPRVREPMPMSALMQHTNTTDLEMGYSMLNDCLAINSKLWMLKGIKRILFHTSSVDEIRDLMDRCSRIAQRRKKELHKLRKLSPNVSAKFEDPNPISNAMNDVIKEKVMREMMDRGVNFDLNFALTQVQGTRLVVASCRGMIPYEVNEERRAWLEDCALEYEALRKDV